MLLEWLIHGYNYTVLSYTLPKMRMHNTNLLMEYLFTGNNIDKYKYTGKWSDHNYWNSKDNKKQPGF